MEEAGRILTSVIANVEFCHAARAHLTDLTDAQWSSLEPLVPAPKSPNHLRHEIVNAMFYVLHSVDACHLVPTICRPARGSVVAFGAGTTMALENGSIWCSANGSSSAGMPNRVGDHGLLVGQDFGKGAFWYNGGEGERSQAALPRRYQLSGGHWTAMASSCGAPRPVPDWETERLGWEVMMVRRLRLAAGGAEVCLIKDDERRTAPGTNASTSPRTASWRND